MGASGGGSGTRSARPAHLRFGDLINFREDQRRFIFERYLHGFEIGFRIFSGAEFESQIAQIVVDTIAALEQLIELSAMRGQVGGIGLNIENENQRRGCECEACAQHGPICGGDAVQNESREMIHQSCVSRAARKRARSSVSSEMPLLFAAPLTTAFTGRLRHRLITKSTSTSPTARYTAGMLQAT